MRLASLPGRVSGVRRAPSSSAGGDGGGRAVHLKKVAQLIGARPAPAVLTHDTANRSWGPYQRKARFTVRSDGRVRIETWDEQQRPGEVAPRRYSGDDWIASASDARVYWKKLIGWGYQR